MDQPTLGCKYPIIYTPDTGMNHSSSTADGSGNRASLRVSHSDTHLHVPHFLSVENRGFHTNLPSLFESISGFNSHQQQVEEKMDRLDPSGAERKFSLNKPGLDRNKSAFELSSKATDNEESANALRKASSVSNYNLETHDHLPRQNSSSLLSSAFHFVTGNSNASPLAVQKISEDDEGGLKMMVSSGSSFSSGALTSSRVLHADPIVHNNPSTHLADVGSLTERNERKPSGVFGIFNKGFFAKPVLNDRENSYRYLLAADKF